MNKYEQEIIAQLNDSAAKAVKGSEYGPDEHVFGIAAQIIEEKNKELEAKDKKLVKLGEILESLVDLDNSGLMESSRLSAQLNKARDLLGLW